MPPEGQGIHADQLRFNLTACPETQQTAILLNDLCSEAQAQLAESRLGLSSQCVVVVVGN